MRIGSAARVRLAALFAGFCLAAPPLAAADEPAALRDEAFQAAQWALTTSAGQALAQMGARFASGSDALAALVRQRQDAVELWRARDKQLLDTLAHNDPDSTKLAGQLRDELDRLTKQIADLDAELAQKFPDYADLSNPKPLAIADVQKLLKNGEALVLFLVTIEDSYVWAVTRDHAAWTKVAMGADALSEKVKKLRTTLDPSGSTRAAESAFGDDVAEGGLPFDRTTAHELYEKFLAPLHDVLDGAKSLLVVPDGAFTSLPLSVLVTAPPEGDDTDPEALRTTPWLIRTYALTTLPAVSSLKALRLFGQRSEGTDPFRGFGSPALVGPGGAKPDRGAGVRAASAYFRGRLANVEAVRELNPLPATADELRRMAAAFGADPAKTLSLGAAATETAVKSAPLGKSRIVAFATHGLVTGDLTGLAEPALVLTPPQEASDEDDGLLTASEAAGLHLAADWVVLSACNTAAGDGTPGADGLSGLARAFLYAGARAILVSHWPVRDDAAAALTTGAIGDLIKEPGIGRAEALRRSMIAVMDDDRDPSLAHPSAWAPFVVVGEGGAGL